MTRKKISNIFLHLEFLGDVEPRTLDEIDFSFNKGSDEIVLVLETHENRENLEMQGIFYIKFSFIYIKVRIELSCCTLFPH